MLEPALVTGLAVFGLLHLLLLVLPRRVKLSERVQLFLCLGAGIGTARYIEASHYVLVGAASGAFAFSWGLLMSLVTITGDQAIRRFVRR